MTDKEKSIRFKNILLGPTFLNDGTHFADTLGLDDFQFWRHIEEKPPYLPATMPLSPRIRGQVILERIEIEPSPKRMADLLQGVYETFAFYSTTPRGNYDDHWDQFARWLHGHVQSIGLTGMKIRWIEKPKLAYTTDITHEKYYVPGELKITYDGLDWGEEESKKILEHGFTSRVLADAREAQKLMLKNKPEAAKKWWEKTWIQAIIVIAAILGIFSFFHR